jgi:ubiquinone/menaquinone biosynthesis C-methylase UbiE
MNRPKTIACCLALLFATTALAQDASVKPGINDSFRDPNVEEFTERFEVESREVFANRNEIVAACDIEPGQTVADIGAGTGLFTRLFAAEVDKTGRVIAVDIAPNFIEHIKQTSRAAGLQNVDTLLCTADSTKLPANSVDVAFICDTYHHFEFPHKTMASLYQAMKPGGQVIVIDFHRIEGKSSEWTLSHVRAGQEVFEKEIEQAGFRKLREVGDLLSENYFVVFQKPNAEPKSRQVEQPTDQQQGRAGAGRRGPPPGRGPRFGRGPGPELRADQDVFHYLLRHRADIRRSVKQIEGGVETLTESDKPEVAAKIQEHVDAMHRRVTTGRGFRYWDELFAAIFEHHKSIRMEVTPTDQGVRVVETSDEPAVTALIRAHAKVVSNFVAHGFDEAHKNHPVPAVGEAAAN